MLTMWLIGGLYTASLIDPYDRKGFLWLIKVMFTWPVMLGRHHGTTPK